MIPSLQDPSVNNSKSTKKRWEAWMKPLNMYPLYIPEEVELEIMQLNPSINKIKRKGAKGQPCLSPHLGLMKLLTKPLMSTTNETDCIVARIQLTR